MKYAHIDENNKLLGWYSDDIHSEIPTPNVQVTEEQWQEALTNNYNKINKDGSGEVYDFRTEDEISKDTIQNQIAIYKDYLNKTDHKTFNDYEPLENEVVQDIISQRKVARDFIRANKL